jgi:hypothetical protein
MALAVMARYLRGDHPRITAGLTSLRGHQRHDGQLVGPTAMCAPRPFLTDDPLQSHALAASGARVLAERPSNAPIEGDREGEVHS